MPDFTDVENLTVEQQQAFRDAIKTPWASGQNNLRATFFDELPIGEQIIVGLDVDGEFNQAIVIPFNEPGGVPQINDEGIIHARVAVFGGTIGEVQNEIFTKNELAVEWHGDTAFNLRVGDGTTPGGQVLATQQDTGLTPVPPPSSDFDWLPCNIYRDLQGNFTTDLDIKSLRVPTTETYYVSPDGDDANDGLSAEEPKKSIGALLDELNATPPPGGATIILSPGLYSGTDGPDGKSIDFACNLVCPNGTATFATMYQVDDWAPHSTYTNTYTGTAPYVQPPIALDYSDVDDYGFPTRLARLTNALVNETPGSFNGGTSTVVIRTKDSRPPDNNIWFLGNSGLLLRLSTPQAIYIEGVAFWGSGYPVRVIAALGSMQITFHRCSFAYSAVANGLEITADANASSRQVTAILSQCKSAYNTEDGFGYRRYAKVAEIDCYGVWNGGNGWMPNDAGSNNGSTTHDSVVSVRINGTYRHNNDRNVHDVTGTQNWLVGCVASDALVDSADPYESSNYVAGRQGQPDATLMWLEGCLSEGGSASDVASYGNAVIQLSDCDGMTVRHGDGTIDDTWA